MRVLSTLVEVSHAVGSSLDLTTIFRAVYEKVRDSWEADAFYVALGTPASGELSFRYLVDGGREMEPTKFRSEGTLGGICIAQDRPLLLRDAPRDYEAMGLARTGWGTVRERSIMVTPMHVRGDVIGAISVQSANANAYDEADLELLGAIANETAFAIERSELHQRTAALSGRLFELHRVGLELSSGRDVPSVARRLCASARDLVGSSAVVVYLDSGGDSFEFAAREGRSDIEVPSLPKSLPLTSRAIAEGVVEVADSVDAPHESRQMLERSGHRAVLLYPLRAASELVGMAFVTWREPHSVTREERELLDILMNVGATAIRSLRLYSELDEAYLSTVQTLMTTIQARDGYREDHGRRVAGTACALGERLGLDEASLRDLRHAALFHSLGKIAVPPTILAKSAPLTDEERRLVREHPMLGARLLEGIRFLRGVVPIVRHANERWNGSGYPEGLAYEAIPYGARILQIAIVYEAMLVDRPYRRALSPADALSEIRVLAGSRFDPGLAAPFVDMLETSGAGQTIEHVVSSGARELAILAEITPEFGAVLDLDQMLERVLAILARHFPGCSVMMLIREEDTRDLVIRARAGDDAGPHPVTRRQPGQGLAQHVLQTREPALIDDVRNEPRWIGRESARSVLMVPLINEGRAIGVLSFVSDHQGAFARQDLTLVQAIAAQVAAAVEVAELHERLKRAANYDALTGLHNFRYFYLRLEEEIARAERRSSPIAVAYFDIDQLKAINDEHGHLAGDEALRSLGKAIAGHVRAEDVPARYGGDEFAIVMPDTGRDEAERVVHRLMEVLDASPIQLDEDRSIPMPARSWGVASYPIDGVTAKELVENADTRAYARKRAKA